MGASAVLFLGSCGKFVDGYEISPNDPVESSPALLLTVSEVQTFMTYSGQLARLSSVLMQQQAGTDGQFQQVAAFNIIPGDNDNEWENVYSALLDAKTLVEKAGDANPYYRGMARVIMAMNLGIATDIWGDMPYSTALDGINLNLNPTFDSQESILNEVQNLLSLAIADFAKLEEDNVLLPAADDLIFGGDIANWTITAHVLKARYANRLSKRDASASATAALQHIDNAIAAGMTSSASDCNAKFGSSGNELNQWYAFVFQERQGYIKMGKYFVDTLASLNDPRLPFYAAEDAAGGYSGTGLGLYTQSTSDIGTYFADATSNAPMATFVEAKFIEAEAALRAGNATRAADAHNAAVMAHIQQVTGASAPAAYVLANASETALTISLNKIMFQKYLAMFTQVEAWTDWRRTGVPALPMTPDAFTTEIPRRLPTPLTEINYNTNAPNVRDITTHIWWDN